jgi:hypothetical protein
MAVTNPTNNNYLGSGGSLFLTTADGATTGDFVGFKVIAAGQLTAITLDRDSIGSARLVAASLAANLEVRVKFSAVTVASGTIQVFKA